MSIQYVIDHDENLNYTNMYDGPGTMYNFYIKLLQKPTLDSLLQFVVHVYASGGTEIIVKTPLMLVY